MALKAPNAMSTQPKPCPTTAATLVAQAKSFLTAQSMERKTLPPSKGKAGTKLKAASSEFMKPK